MEVEVLDNIEQALKQLKKRMAFEGVFRELKKRRHYDKPSIQKRKKRQEAERRRRKRERRAKAMARRRAISTAPFHIGTASGSGGAARRNPPSGRRFHHITAPLSAMNRIEPAKARLSAMFHAPI
ncbi:MAG: 30S ribosomal protein S21 [Alphaproteobacteria bacterium HGW-Alphaproteobacteria-5]|nr:MAG: 30S ribosomal protein S21 [Alphaproteobacteria bacterium HGW-Alphaproteobacteria-5]